MNDGLLNGFESTIGTYNPMPTGGASPSSSRGRLSIDQIRLWGYPDNATSTVSGAARLINTNAQQTGKINNLFFTGDLGTVVNVMNGNWITQTGFPPWEAAFNIAGNLNFSPPLGGAGQGGMFGYVTNAVFQNQPSIAASIPFLVTCSNSSLFQANGAACTLIPTGPDFSSSPAIGAVNAGTISMSSLIHFGANGGTTGTSANVTVTTRTGFHCSNFNYAGATATTQLGLDIDTFTGATTNTGIRVFNGNASYSAAPGTAVSIMPSTYTYTAAVTLSNILAITPTYTLTAGTSNLAGGTLVNISPTLDCQATLLGLGNLLSFRPVYQADTGTGMNIQGMTNCLILPSVTTTNAGTFTNGTITNFSSGFTLNASGSTIASFTHFQISAANLTAGTLTTQTGISIAALGGTTPTGIINASPTVNTASGSQTLAAATTVRANATTIQVAQTSGSNITLTATPTVAPTSGASLQDGQIVNIINVSTSATNTFTFQSNGTLAGSNLSLGAATRAVGFKGSLTLVYNATLTRWVEIGFNAGGNA